MPDQPHFFKFSDALLGKVLYFMLSGGRVFNREMHRVLNWNLVEINQDIQLEHVNNLLDHMITSNPGERYPAVKIATETKKIKRLIHGEYSQLEVNKFSRCRFCGIGFYRPIVNSDENFMQFFGFSSSAIQGGGRGWRAMVCDYCGHVELFRMDGAPNKWWPEKK